MLCNLAALFQESAWTTPFLWRRIVAVQAVQRRLVLPNLLALVSSSHMPKRTEGRTSRIFLKPLTLKGAYACERAATRVGPPCHEAESSNVADARSMESS